MSYEILEELGLSEREILIYTTLLEYGPNSVRGISRLIDVNRGSVYDSIKNLQDSNLVSYYHDETKHHFVAEDPKAVMQLYYEQENNLKILKNNLKSFLPVLEGLQNKGDNKPVLKFYRGKKGIKEILLDVINTMKVLEGENREYYVYSASTIRKHLYDALPDFIEERKAHSIYVKTISLTKSGKTFGLDERKYLTNKRKINIDMTYILLYGNKSAFISQDSYKKPFGVILENSMIYQTQSMIFNQIWDLL